MPISWKETVNEYLGCTQHVSCGGELSEVTYFLTESGAAWEAAFIHRDSTHGIEIGTFLTRQEAANCCDAHNLKRGL